MANAKHATIVKHRQKLMNDIVKTMPWGRKRIKKKSVQKRYLVKFFEFRNGKHEYILPGQVVVRSFEKRADISQDQR